MEKFLLKFILILAIAALAVALIGCLESEGGNGNLLDGDEESTDSTDDRLDCESACSMFASCAAVDAADTEYISQVKDDCISLCENDDALLSCLEESEGCLELSACLPTTDGDGEEEASDDDRIDLPERCEGACEVSPFAFCIGDSLCACIGLQWSLILCAETCRGSGQVFESCEHNQNLGYDECICSDVTPDSCQGECDQEGTGFCLDIDDFCFCREGQWRKIDCDEYCEQAWQISEGFCEQTSQGASCSCSSGD